MDKVVAQEVEGVWNTGNVEVKEEEEVKGDEVEEEMRWRRRWVGGGDEVEEEQSGRERKRMRQGNEPKILAQALSL